MSTTETIRRERKRTRHKDFRPEAGHPRQIIRWPEVLKILPYRETQARQLLVDTGRLRPVQLGPRAVGFVLSEVLAIVDELIEKRDAEAAKVA